MALGFHTATPDLALLGPRDRRRAGFSLAVLGVLSLASGFGLVASAYLVNHHPLLLIALSPIGRHLVLVVPKLNPVLLILVAGLRRLVFYLACFQLGRALGPSGVAWLEQRAERFARRGCTTVRRSHCHSLSIERLRCWASNVATSGFIL